ncbi:PEP-CTERM sorting domain-containing protein [Rubritalea spongiae]|uniref:PEP-CTERM sorting domain-containing protein n=1 Tax=Rubritalea spongiae TaxID=430797 RepID=A0ABW5E0W5_9BACT
MKSTILSTIACLSVSGIASAATYIWNGNANDQNWSSAGNWDGGTAPALLSSPSGTYDTIIFDGSNMPTANVPGYASGTNINSSNLQFNSGGTFSFSLSGSFGSAPISNTSRTWLTVGDGIGTAGDVTVNMNDATTLYRHSSNTLNYLVNSDGVLNISSDLNLYADNNKHVTFTLNGGSLISTGAVTTSFNNGDNLTDSYFLFDAVGSSFTANYGGVFTDFVSLQADTTNKLRTASGLSLDFTDNGTSFTVTAVPEPSSLALLGLGSLSLLTRRRR